MPNAVLRKRQGNGTVFAGSLRCFDADIAAILGEYGFPALGDGFLADGGAHGFVELGGNFRVAPIRQRIQYALRALEQGVRVSCGKRAKRQRQDNQKDRKQFFHK